MPEDKKTEIILEFSKAMAARDLEKTLSYLTEDAVWVDPSGTYKGKEVIKSHWSTGFRSMKDTKFVETGNGIIVQGDKAFFEYIACGITQSNKFETPAMWAFEFTGDKIKNIRTVYDRLLMAQQVAKGWPAKPLINMIVRQSEKAMK